MKYDTFYPEQPVVVTTDEGRTYTFNDPKLGVVTYPSVTTVINVGRKAFFEEWNKKNPGALKRAGDRGTALHEMIEAWLKDEPPKDVDEVVSDMFRQMFPHLQKIGEIYGLETPLYSNILKIAGRVDCIGMYDGLLSIIDFKSSTRAKREEYVESYFLQATAYAIMFQELTGTPIDRIVVLIASEDGICQPFVRRPIEYVPKLFSKIKEYREANSQ